MMNFDSFELYLERGGRKRITIKTTIDSIKRLYKANADWDQSLDSFESTLLLLRRKGLRNTSLNRLIYSVKVYATFLKRDDLHSVKSFKEEPSNKGILSDEDLERILDMPRIRMTPVEIWNQMSIFFSILIYSGARPGEVAKLTDETVDFGTNNFTFLDTKTHENRVVPIHPILIEKYRLREYVSSKTGYLFPSSRGGLNNEGLPVLSQAEWNRNFKKRLEILGIKNKNITTYSCRHSWITRMIDADVNLFKIQRIVGHKKIETTAVYTHLSSKQDQHTVQSDPLGLRSVSPQKALQRVRELITPTIEKDDRFAWEYSDTSIIIRLK